MHVLVDTAVVHLHVYCNCDILTIAKLRFEQIYYEYDGEQGGRVVLV